MVQYLESFKLLSEFPLRNIASFPTTGEAISPNAWPGVARGSGQATVQWEAEAPVCWSGQYHWTLDSDQDGGVSPCTLLTFKVVT